ncbi:response regulator [Parasedimentitalea maritima]|uniref:histidine kinase n=1 Tax=Parasedimentitalea maritima TaxID=2578117 RepID=A0ABY2UX01_9RHOB|nr:response regulator [Zongyanglinia marina]
MSEQLHVLRRCDAVDQNQDDPVFQKITELVPQEFTKALTDAGIGLWLWDVKADQLDVSRGMVQLTGLKQLYRGSRLDVLRDLIHPEDVETIQASTRRLFEDGLPYETLCRMRHSSGHFVWANTYGSLVRDENGEPQKMIGIVRVMDELTRTKRDLLHAEEMARLGNWTVDLATDELIWSQGVYKILGYEPFSFQPTLEFARKLRAEEDRAMIEGLIDEAVKKSGAFEYRTRVPHTSGKEVHIKVNGAIETGITGAPVSYYGTMQNITAEIQRDEQIRQSQKLETIGKLTGGVAHDFNNLLAVILGSLELAQDDIEDSGVNELIQMAIQATMRGVELTGSMLSFARQAKLKPQILDLHSVVEQTNSWIARTLPENISIETSLPTDLWPISADPGSTENALLNLILNARDAMAKGGELTIEAANVIIDSDFSFQRNDEVSPGQYVMLAISDTGEGIPANILKEIYEPFFTTKAPGAGSGLGLSMVQGFMHQSGGTVQVYSEPGVGTTFKLYFKALSRKIETPTIEAAKTKTANGAGFKILVAEDEKEVLEILLATLRQAGYAVTAARSGDEAREIFEADPSFDLLLTDIVMPGSLQGTTLAQLLRKQAKDLPVVFLSGYASEATVRRNEVRSEDIRLTKPVRRIELLEALEKTLASRVEPKL